MESDPFDGACGWNEAYRHQIFKATDQQVYYKRNEPVDGSVAWPLCVLLAPSELLCNPQSSQSGYGRVMNICEMEQGMFFRPVYTLFYLEMLF